MSITENIRKSLHMCKEIFLSQM